MIPKLLKLVLSLKSYDNLNLNGDVSAAMFCRVPGTEAAG
jgi:hypothetical protein